MFRVESTMLRTLGLVALLLAAAIPAQGAGFLIFEQGAKAMGMAGAFTAQADDPSALFHNAGGIAFQNKRDFLLGGTLVTGEADFSGRLPFRVRGHRADRKAAGAGPSLLLGRADQRSADLRSGSQCALRSVGGMEGPGQLHGQITSALSPL